MVFRYLRGCHRMKGVDWGLRGAQAAELGLTNKENFLTDSPRAALKGNERSGCVSRLPFSQSQGKPLRISGQVGAGLPLLRRERGMRCHPHLGCRPGPPCSELPSSTSTVSTLAWHPCHSPSDWAPCSCSCPPPAYSPLFTQSKSLKNRPGSSKSFNGCPTLTGESPGFFLFFTTSFLLFKNKAEMISSLTIAQP